MIKVSFRSSNGIDDVCRRLEITVTNQVDMEQWLLQHVKSLCFECMDYPHDLDAYFDCFFSSADELHDARRVYFLLGRELRSCGDVQFDVCLTDAALAPVVNIGTCPYCGQGSIVCRTVRKSMEDIMICEECDTVWESRDWIEERPGMRFDYFAKAHGMKALWSEFVI